MKEAFQRWLIRTYGLVLSTGLLSTAWGDRVFRSAYGGYKRFFEAGRLAPLQRLIAPGTSVVDVGANIGFFTVKFAQWVSAGGTVIAIEPEPINIARLKRTLASAGLADVVETVQAAAAEKCGEVRLMVDPVHPGNHRISHLGTPVSAVTIDTLLAARGWPPVSLIKIDVQGAEARVLAGAEETLRELQPALFIEVCDEALRMLASSAQELLVGLNRLGYSAHLLTQKDVSGPMSVSQALEYHQGRSYVDFLFLPERR